MNRLQLEHIEIHDLTLGKYVSGREKDLVFNTQVIGLGLVSQETLLERMGSLLVPAAIKDRIRTKIKTDFSSVQPCPRHH